MTRAASLRTAAALLLVATVGCAGSGKMPAWVDDPGTEYPASTHLSAVGSAHDRQAAADRALANIARIFEVEVRDATLDFSRAEISTEQDQQVTTNEQQVTRRVSTAARQELEGAEVVEYWQSEAGRVYALAVLARQPAAGRFREAIVAMDREVDDLIDYASTTAENPVAAFRALSQARSVQLERERINANLMVVTNGKGVGSRYDTAGIDDLIRDSLAELAVVVQGETQTVHTELEQALASLGVQLVHQSNLTLRGVMDVAPVEQKQGWYWLRGSYELAFEDNGVALAKKRWPIKVSATDEAVLEKRARDEINRQLPQYVYELLSSE